MNFALYPLAFYATLMIWALAMVYAATGLRQAWGVPAIVVLLTVAGWYIGDALYNNYEGYFWEFGMDTLDNAWWQVGGFILAFVIMVKPVSSSINRNLANEGSFAMRMYEGKMKNEDAVQSRIDQASKALMSIWVVLTMIGLFRVDWDVVGVFLPFLKGEVLNPWGRAQIGSGFDAVLSLIGYVQMFLTATFGVIWAVSKNPRTRSLAGIIFLLSAPMYLFDRTRNAMLAVVVPGLMAWVVLRLRTTWMIRSVVLVAAFLAINFWMLFVMENRGRGSIASAVQQEGAFNLSEEAVHQGLNMFEELSWINHYIKLGMYEPNWGHRYFAEVANIVPRALWPGKPTIGLDYSVLRGQLQDDTSGMVTATVSTGMIGQGVVNFGGILGPIFAAWLMTIWVALLARQDLLAESHPSRFLIYAMGIILTFNMGRDITPLVCYPFFFGYALVYYLEKRRGGQRSEDRGRRTEVGAAGVRGVSVSAGELQKAGEDSHMRDERRDVGTGGTVRTMPGKMPRRTTSWMPRRLRKSIMAQTAVDNGEKGTEIENDDGKSGQVRVAGNGARPRQLGVPFQNYRRYRG